VTIAVVSVAAILVGQMVVGTRFYVMYVMVPIVVAVAVPAIVVVAVEAAAVAFAMAATVSAVMAAATARVVTASLTAALATVVLLQGLLQWLSCAW
jgi:hypothetical protein